MKSFFSSTLLTLLLSSFYSCKKEAVPNPGTQMDLQSLHTWNSVIPTIVSVNAALGSEFTTPLGTKVTVSGGSWEFHDGTPVSSGSIRFQFGEYYRKSDLLWSTGLSTSTESGLFDFDGIYVISASANDQFNHNKPVRLSGAKPILIERPWATDPAMKAFQFRGQKLLSQAGFWNATEENPHLQSTGGRYMLSIDSFVNSIGSPGQSSYSAIANKAFFDQYEKTTVTVQGPPDAHYNYYFSVEHYILIDGHNSIVKLSGDQFKNAPVGLTATLVVIGYRNGKLYSAFVPFRIEKNKVLEYALRETNAEGIASKVKALDYK